MNSTAAEPEPGKTRKKVSDALRIAYAHWLTGVVRERGFQVRPLNHDHSASVRHVSQAR